MHPGQTAARHVVRVDEAEDELAQSQDGCGQRLVPKRAPSTLALRLSGR
jgi:hypothetical protein